MKKKKETDFDTQLVGNLFKGWEIVCFSVPDWTPFEEATKNLFEKDLRFFYFQIIWFFYF